MENTIQNFYQGTPKELCIKDLKTWLENQGDKKIIYSIFRHSTDTGTRYFDFYMIIGQELNRITWTLHLAFDLDYDKKRECLKFTGTGYSVETDIAEMLKREYGFDVIVRKA